jgi:intein/homing endonuclease
MDNTFANESSTDLLHPETLDNVWLGLGDTSKIQTPFNPLIPQTDFDRSHPHLHLLKVIRNVDYIGFTAEHILNIQLYPFQQVVLKAMFTHPYFMLVANRGFGKCVTGDTLLQTRKGIFRIDELVRSDVRAQSPQYADYDVLDDKGFVKVEYGWTNGVTKTVKIQTGFGYTLEGTPNHPVKVVDQYGNLVWKHLGKIHLKHDKIVIPRKLYKFDNKVPFEQSYFYNLGKKFKGDSIPQLVRQSSTSDLAAFLGGIYENAYVRENKVILGGYSDELLRQIHATLLGFGIFAKFVKNKIFIYHKLSLKLFLRWICRSKRIRRKLVPNSAGSFKVDRKENYYLDIIVKSSASEAVTYDVHIPESHAFISNGILSHNTFLLAVYAVLKALIYQGSKVVVAGSVFRQSRFITDHCESIWHNSPVLQDLVSHGANNYIKKRNGFHKESDRHVLWIGESNITALPIGDGCLHGDSLVLTNSGFRRIRDLSQSRTAHIYSNGQFRAFDEFINNGYKPTKKITTELGYSFEGTHNHAMRILAENGSIEWRRADQMKVGDVLLIDRSKRWHYKKEFALKNAWNRFYKLGRNYGKNLCKYKRIKKQLRKQLDDFKDTFFYESVLSRYSEILTDPTVDNQLFRLSRRLFARFLRGFFDGARFDGERFHFKTTYFLPEIQSILLCYGILVKRDRRSLQVMYRFSWDRFISLVKTNRQDRLSKYKLCRRYAGKPNYEQYAGFDGLANQVLERYNLHGKVKKADLRLVRKILPNFTQTDFGRYVAWLNSSKVFLDPIKSIEDREACTYDIHVPDNNEYIANGFISHNSKIRGQRASTLLVDEFSSLRESIFQEIIKPFISVRLNPIESAKRRARIEYLRSIGQEVDDRDELANQLVISGTADYDFKHFCKMWKQYKGVIESYNDKMKVLELFDGKPPEKLDPRSWCVVRMPVELLPKDYMDEGAVATMLATSTESQILMELGATFPTDSDGFFKRSIIEACTCDKPIKLPGGMVQFPVSVSGNPQLKYVMGIDPASERDNFAIVILELWPDHRRIVYSWTTRKSTFRQKGGQGDFFRFCTRKIRNLMKTFNICRIALDMGGGGIQVKEALGYDETILERDKDGNPIEQFIWPVINYDEPKDSDQNAGLHIIEESQFGKNDWVSEANNGLKKDFEDKMIIFPYCDGLELGIVILEREERTKGDKTEDVYKDELSDIMLEIQEMKNELSTIIYMETETGRGRWTTPEVKREGDKKGRLRKDRYSALLIANMAARCIQKSEPQRESTEILGRLVGQGGKADGLLYRGPDWFTKPAGQNYSGMGKAVNRTSVVHGPRR